MIQIVLILLTALNIPKTTSPSHYVPYGAGGPDAYGYRWIDNDTTGPSNVPTFFWKDISTVGIRVTGLGDDNVVGPFPIGFNFPYYWYRVNSFYIGSNGYIAFGDNTLAAPTYPNGFYDFAPPNPNRPNNMVAPLLSDFDFNSVDPGDTARCFYWTNAAHDTCIISYINLRWWYQDHAQSAATRCTFQIILTKLDSSLTFQYKKIVGTPYHGWATNNNATGMENIIGIVGLRYLLGLSPSQNALHDTLAVKFYPPNSTTYQVMDAGIWNAMNENSGATFLFNSTPTAMWAKVKNAGNQPVMSCSVFCQVHNRANSIVYSSSTVIPSMVAGQLDSVTFTPSWTPTATGLYTSVFRAKATGDIYPPNDSVIVETRVVIYPTELLYDDSIVDQARSWTGGGGGFGNKFFPPRYPCQITGALIAMYHGGPSSTTCTLFVYKADGPGETPGTVLGRGIVSVSATSPTLYLMNLNQTINSGAFFVGAIASAAPNCTTWFCVDSTQPRSYQGWEYTTSWAPDREQSVYDLMIRALVDLGQGVKELLPVGVGNTKMQLSAYPNPFVNKTKIRFINKASPLSILEIYNAVGERVDKLSTTEEFVNWKGTDRNGRKVSPGIYFVKLKTENVPVLKILMLN